MGSRSSSKQQQQQHLDQKKKMNKYEAIYPTHHDIVKQYRKRLTAVVGKCVYISYNRYHSVPKCFICYCSGRDSCMLTSRCYPGCHRHLTPLYVPVSPCTRSVTCKPCHMALVPDTTVHCSRPPVRNLDLSSSDHSQGPWVGLIYIQLLKLFKDGPCMPINTINTRCRAWLDQL